MTKMWPWHRLRTFDKVLVAVLMPIWFISLVLHVDLAVDDLLFRPAILMTSSEVVDGYPVVSQITADSEALVADRQIRLGDELVSINQRDLAGVSGFRASIIAFSMLGEQETVVATFKRGDTVVEKAYPFVDFGVPWWWPSLFAISFGVVGLIVLLSAPRSATAQAIFPAFVSFALTWLIYFGHSEFQTISSLVFYVGSMVFAGPLVIRAIVLLPENTAIKSNTVRYGVWVFALMSISGLSAFTGQPLTAATGQTVHLALIALFYLSILIVLGRNYIKADKLGRRQLRWIILGFYLAFLPAVLVTAIIIQYPQQFNLYALSSVGMPIIPIMFLIAITQYNLFDIDQLIGRSVSYSILVLVIEVLAESIIQPLVEFTGSRYGIDGNVVQVLMLALLTASLIPVQKIWRPLVDRIFFAEGVAVEESIELLIDKLEEYEGVTPTERFNLIGQELAEIYHFKNWAVFAYEPGTKSPLATEGSAPNVKISMDLWKKYEKRVRPGTETLEDNGKFLVAPIRPVGKLEWLLVLGPKISGDVYTPTDNSLIASITHIVAGDIMDQSLVNA